MAGVPRDHAAGEGGQGERGAPAEREEAGVPEAERQVHRQGAQGKTKSGKESDSLKTAQNNILESFRGTPECFIRDMVQFSTYYKRRNKGQN